MTDQKNKQGIHGWRAYILMFGCGTFAALAVVGLVVGGFRLMIAGGNSSSEAPPGQAVKSRKPRESMEVGLLDLCKISELYVLSGMGGSRADVDDGPNDTGEEGESIEGRTVSDECEWDYTSPESGPRSLLLSYRAFVTDSGERGKNELAKEEFKEKLSEVESQFSEIDNEGEAGNLDSDSYFYYSENGEDEKKGKYGVIGKVKSGVYVAVFEDEVESSDSGARKEGGLRSDAVKLDKEIFAAMDRLLPD